MTQGYFIQGSFSVVWGCSAEHLAAHLYSRVHIYLEYELKDSSTLCSVQQSKMCSAQCTDVFYTEHDLKISILYILVSRTLNGQTQYNFSTDPLPRLSRMLVLSPPTACYTVQTKDVQD